MKLRLLLFLLAAHVLCAADGTRVQILAIAAPEQVVAQATLQTTPGDDDRLFNQMAGLVAAGEAEILSVHLLTATSLRAVTVGTRKEFPWPTEFDPREQFGLVVPQSFQFRNLGASTTVQRHGTAGMPLAVKWERTRFHDWLWFKAAEKWPHARSQQPQFLSESAAGLVRPDRKGWQLCGITGESFPVNTAKPDKARSVMVFARVPRPLASKEAPASPSRLHSFTFQVPLSMALPVLLRERGRAADLLAEILALTATGHAALLEHTACTFTAEHQGSAASIVEYPWPTEFDGIMPISFQFRNVGAQLELKPGGGDTHPLEATLGIVSRVVPMIPVSPQPEAALWQQPVFQSYNVNRAPLPAPGEVLLVGAALDTRADGGPAMLLTILKTAGASPASSSHQTAHIALLSLSAAEGQKLAALPADKALEQLHARAAQPESVQAWRSAVIAQRSAPGVELMREVPSILQSTVRVLDHNPLLTAGTIFFSRGGFLTLFPATDTTPAQLSWTAHFNDPGMPTLEELKTAAGQQTKLPEFKSHGLGLIKPLPAADMLLSLAPANVPAGHSDQGRWHAVLLLIRNN